MPAAGPGRADAGNDASAVAASTVVACGSAHPAPTLQREGLQRGLAEITPGRRRSPRPRARTLPLRLEVPPCEHEPVLAARNGSLAPTHPSADSECSRTQFHPGKPLRFHPGKPLMRTPRNIAVLTAEDDPGPVHRQRSVTAADAGSTLHAPRHRHRRKHRQLPTASLERNTGGRLIGRPAHAR